MTTTLAKDNPAQSIEEVLATGNLNSLTTEQRVTYYMKVCESLSLNPYTRPFDFLTLQGRVVLYARKDATDQLRKIQKISITSLEREQHADLYVVKATAEAADGRRDTAMGAVPIKGLSAVDLANALMKAETKAKRRVTLSICGLGMTDESEVETIPNVVPVQEIPREVIQQRAKRYVEIFGDDTESVQQDASAEEINEALKRNANLLQTAYDAGVKGLRQLSAQANWPITRIEEVNTELGERIKSHNADLDSQAARESGQPML